jgi:hypothetical protein
MKRRTCNNVIALIIAMMVIVAASTSFRASSDTCSGASITLPFSDVVGNLFFCQIAEAYFSGLTNGTTSTTYSPSANVPREQMAAFITRTMDQSLKRGSRRAALKQFWTPASANALGLTTVGTTPILVESDGADLWVANHGGAGTVTRVRASDGTVLETWTAVTGALGVLAAKGQIFVTGSTTPGKLYQLEPAGVVTNLTSALGGSPWGIAFDGARIWTANGVGSVSIVTLNPVSVNTVTTGFSAPYGILYDGDNMWVIDQGTIPGNPGKLFKLDPNGAIIQTVTVGNNPSFPVFDGTNIWVPNFNSNTVTVVRASTGAVLSTLTGNGLSGPTGTAFDGERILVTNNNGNSVSLWKATDLSPLGSVSTGSSTGPLGACSDGLNFWITLRDTDKLARF